MLFNPHKKIFETKNKPKIIFNDGVNTLLQQAIKPLKKYIDPIFLFKNKIEIPKKFPFKSIAIDKINLTKYAQFLYTLLKKKINFKQAKNLVQQPNYLCCIMLKMKEVDGQISGLNFFSKDVFKPAIEILKENENDFISSLCVLEKNNEILVFSDCALNISPNYQQRAKIAIMACNFAKNILKIKKPVCCFLSYSTNNSGKGKLVDEIKKSCVLARQMAKKTNYEFHGEIQFDAAYNQLIRTKKIKNCQWKTKPNIYIFPELNSANIGYKIAQQLGGYKCYGPIVLGLSSPISDLSRGATIEDIIGTIILTVMQIKKK